VSVLLAETPALPLHTAGKYVAGAYIVVFAIVLIYVAIMAIRLGRIEGELGELLALTEEDQLVGRDAGDPGDGGGHPRRDAGDSRRAAADPRHDPGETQEPPHAARESAPA